MVIKVLIVEDEAIVAKDIKKRLLKRDYEVVGIVSTARAAIKKAEEKKPNVVLMDIYLKGEMTGIQAAKEIWKKYKIPVVYLTAYGDDKTVEEAMKTGPVGYLLKPIDDKELDFSIQQAIAQDESEI